MTNTVPRLTGRTLLGAVIAGFSLPQLPLAQSSTTPTFRQGATTLRMRCRFAEHEFTYRLLDNPTVRDLVSLLPLDLAIEDSSTNEKIAHLPRRLDEGGLADFGDEAPGALCYFRGWGNLAFFHDDYQYRGDLIRLGHIEGGVEPLLVRGEFPLRLEPID